MGPSYLPGSTSTVSPGRAKVDARAIVAHGARREQGFESLPSAATYHVCAEPASEAPRKALTNAARISRTVMVTGEHSSPLQKEHGAALRYPTRTYQPGSGRRLPKMRRALPPKIRRFSSSEILAKATLATCGPTARYVASVPNRIFFAPASATMRSKRP